MSNNPRAENPEVEPSNTIREDLRSAYHLLRKIADHYRDSEYYFANHIDSIMESIWDMEISIDANSGALDEIFRDGPDWPAPEASE